MGQNQIGNNTTASSPFVTAEGVVYFQGTDGDKKLWRVNGDGTGQTQIGANQTNSTPLVFADPVTGEWVYFQGTDNKLWKVRGDSAGTDLTQIGPNKTASTPFVTYDGSDVWVYFQGTDNRLLKVKADAAGSDGTQIGSNTTSSAPFVFTDPVTGEWVYFRGTNNKLWKVRSDSAGSELTQIGTNTTSSTPFVTFDSSTNEVWVYFQGTDNTLWKVQSDSAGSGLLNIGQNKTRSAPFVTADGWVYFQALDNRLLKVFNDGTQGAQLGGNTTASTPKVNRIALSNGTVEEWVYFQGTNNALWQYFELVGGNQAQFTAIQNGWHFDNYFVNHIFGSLETKGLCGGMAYSALDYYFNDLPIPTHRLGDFGGKNTVPPDGRLHSMIFNRLIDSFADNFGKWSCVYPELDAAVGAALGLVIGGGLLGAVVGAVWGGVYGELHEVFSCPGGGPAGMTRQELPNLRQNFLDKGIPAPIGLIYDSDILNIGRSHQVVAYGYTLSGTTITIYIYDNRYHDDECTLVLDASNPGTIVQTSKTKGTESWAGLLVSDGYSPQWPSYGPDISIASPQSVQLSGPVVMAPISVGASPTAATMASRSRPGSLRAGLSQIVMMAQQQQAIGNALVDTYSVQNYGEFPAHYSSLGIEIFAPDGSQHFAQGPAATDNRLAPGYTVGVTINVANLGSEPGIYELIAGFNSVGLDIQENPGPGTWNQILYPPASVALASTPIIQISAARPPKSRTQKVAAKRLS